MGEIKIYTRSNSKTVNKPKGKSFTYDYVIEFDTASGSNRLRQSSKHPIRNSNRNQMAVYALYYALIKARQDFNLSNNNLYVTTNSKFVYNATNSWLNKWLKNNFNGIQNAKQWASIVKMLASANSWKLELVDFNQALSHH